jgi:hypothetical protein
MTLWTVLIGNNCSEALFYVNIVFKNLPHFVEHVSVVGNENSEKLRYRSQNCLKVLPFKTSSVASGTCLFCKKLKDHAKTDVCTLFYVNIVF